MPLRPHVESALGRRKPFFLIGAIGCSVCLFPFVAAVWTAVLPPQRLAKGFPAQGFFTGFGITLANISLFAFRRGRSAATR